MFYLLDKYKFFIPMLSVKYQKGPSPWGGEEKIKVTLIFYIYLLTDVFCRTVLVKSLSLLVS